MAALVVFALLGAFVWLWWHWVPVLYQGFNGITQAERLTAITTTRAALLAALVGIGALGTFWVNSRSQRFAAESVRISQQNLELTRRDQDVTYRLAERGHLTDRYSRAIDHLGSDKPDVRLGGIYALEQLATDSDRAGDQAVIVEVLSAFVREHSDPTYRLRQHQAALKIKVPGPDDPAEQVQIERKHAMRHVAEYPLPGDVQAAITVLGRLPERPDSGRGDLRGVYLRRAVMSKGMMAYFEPSEMQVIMWQFGDDPKDATTGNFARTTFANAELSGAFLTSANLTDTRFLDTNLTNAWLNYSDLTGALFSQADLTNADLEGANLTDANLAGAILTNTRLHGANLAFAKGVTQERLDTATGDATTRIPADLQLPASWLRAAGEQGVILDYQEMPTRQGRDRFQHSIVRNCPAAYSWKAIKDRDS